MVSMDKLSADKNHLGHKLSTMVVTDSHFKSIILLDTDKPFFFLSGEQTFMILI